MEIIISSKLKPEELLAKIQEQADQERNFFIGLFGSKPFLIRLKGLKFQLYKRIYYRNSFIPIFYGTLQPTSGGSEIQGEFHMFWGVRIFMAIWFGGVSLGVLDTLYDVIRKGFPQEHPEMLLIPFGMLLLGYLLIKVGQVMSRSHQQIILRYLRSCAGLEESQPETFMVKPFLRPGLWPYELLVRRGLAFLWDSVIPGLPIIFLMTQHPKHFLSFDGEIFLPCFFFYETFCLARWGRGLGKKMAQLVVKTVEGKKPTRGRVLLRTGVKTVFLAPVYLDPNGTWLAGLSVALFLIPWIIDKNHRFLHDRFAKTQVLLEG